MTQDDGSDGLDLPYEEPDGTVDEAEQRVAATEPPPTAATGPDESSERAATATAPPLPPPNPTPTRSRREKWIREGASWLIPVAALGLGLGYRCMRQPIFIEQASIAGGVPNVQPGQVVSLGVFPRPEGKREVRITGAHLTGATKGLKVVKVVGANLTDRPPAIPGKIGEPTKPIPLSKLRIKTGLANYLVLEVKADAPGAYTAKGVDISYTSGFQRGTHHMKVTVSLTVVDKK